MAEHSHLTPIQKRILQFFQEQPHAVETVRGISTWLCMETDIVQEALQELVSREWLSADQTEAVTGYALTGDEQILVEIKEALEAL